MDQIERPSSEETPEYVEGFGGLEIRQLGHNGMISLVPFNGRVLDEDYRVRVVPFTLLNDSPPGPIYIFARDMVRLDFVPPDIIRHRTVVTDDAGRASLLAGLRPHAGVCPGKKLVLGRGSYCTVLPAANWDGWQNKIDLPKDILRQLLKERDGEIPDQRIDRLALAFRAAIGELLAGAEGGTGDASVKIDVVLNGKRIVGSFSVGQAKDGDN